MASLLPAELAWYVTGRFYAAPDGAMADYGYFLHLGPIAPLFTGTPGEASAHFTFAAQPFTATPVSNGALQLGMDAVGDFSVYLQREPAGDFDHPESFARGERIATFRRSCVVLGTTVHTAAAAHAPGLIALNAFTARLVESVPFTWAGRDHDLAQILGRGVTQFGTAATAAVPTATRPHDVVLPFSGSAIALG